MKILAVVVTYFPEKEVLERNVSLFIDRVDKLIIWENTPSEEAWNYRFIKAGGKIEYRGEGRNAGISHALNCALGEALDKGYDFLLTMDQDSQLEGIDSAIEYARKTGGNALYGPVVNEKASKTNLLAKFLITSGMLVPVKLLESLGGYEEDFFTDGIDAELCCRALDAGVELHIPAGYAIKQRLGTEERGNFLWMHPVLRNYSPERLYGIYRNHIIVIGRYRSTGWLKRRFLKVWILRRLWQIPLLEKNGREKLKSALKGIRDGLRYKSAQIL